MCHSSIIPFIHLCPFIRLRVPFYGAILDFLNFSLLLLTFVLCLSSRPLLIHRPHSILIYHSDGQLSSHWLGIALHDLCNRICARGVHRSNGAWLDQYELCFSCFIIAHQANAVYIANVPSLSSFNGFSPLIFSSSGMSLISLSLSFFCHISFFEQKA